MLWHLPFAGPDGSDDCTVTRDVGRDVSLNLRIVTERTAELGIDGHICELQLILRSFAELKVPLSRCLHKIQRSEQEIWLTAGVKVEWHC